MSFESAAKNRMLDALVGAASGSPITHASLHSGFPATALNEISGGSPAYARKAITFNAAVNGSITPSNQPQFDVAGSTTVAGVGLWTALTSGTLMGGGDVTDEAFAGQGTYTLTGCTLSIAD